MTDSLIARMNNKRTITEIALAILVIVGLACLARWYFPKTPKKLQAQGAVISLEIADSTDERRVGLSGRGSLRQGTGMLFVFRAPGYHSFWMPNMFFPIDIIWMDRDFTVVDVENNVVPDSYPTLYRPMTEALYVLELNAGESEALGIQTGATLTPIYGN